MLNLQTTSLKYTEINCLSRPYLEHAECEYIVLKV